MAVCPDNVTTERLDHLPAGVIGMSIGQIGTAVAQQSLAVGQRFGEALVKEMQQTLTDELRKRGHKL